MSCSGAYMCLSVRGALLAIASGEQITYANGKTNGDSGCSEACVCDEHCKDLEDATDCFKDVICGDKKDGTPTNDWDLLRKYRDKSNYGGLYEKIDECIMEQQD